MKTYAFVFARGGSKGLPKKNILSIAGIPMIVHSISCAKQIDVIDDIFVSTDCNDIANIAYEAGAQVIHRPSELASDSSPEWLSWQHAIKWVQLRYGHFDRFLSLPATAPCRSNEDVIQCLDALSTDVDLVLTITRSQRSPWFNMVTKDSNDNLNVVMNSSGITRRQDVPDSFDISTVAYVARPAFILSSSSMWQGKVRGVEVPQERAIDIDTYVDYEIANFLKQKILHGAFE